MSRLFVGSVIGFAAGLKSGKNAFVEGERNKRFFAIRMNGNRGGQLSTFADHLSIEFDPEHIEITVVFLQKSPSQKLVEQIGRNAYGLSVGIDGFAWFFFAGIHCFGRRFRNSRLIRRRGSGNLCVCSFASAVWFVGLCAKQGRKHHEQAADFEYFSGNLHVAPPREGFLKTIETTPELNALAFDIKQPKQAGWMHDRTFSQTCT